MAKIFTREQELLRNLWRKAYRNGELRIDFQSESQAHQARMRLYSAVKREKHEGNSEDFEVYQAAQTIEIVFGTSKTQLLMRSRSHSPIIAAFEKAAGERLQDAASPNEKESVEAARRLADELDKEAKVAPAPAQPTDDGLAKEYRKNPFYKRS